MTRISDAVSDYYETLQISVNADPETIQRVYRLLARRYHPDNIETGSAERFRELTEAHHVLSDPQRRAQYDAVHQQTCRERWKIVEHSRGEIDVPSEQIVRLTLLELLYTRRRAEPRRAALSLLEAEQLIGRPREHLEFTVWFLTQKRFIQRGDDSALAITAEGVEYLETNIVGSVQTRLLRPQND